MSVPQPSQLDCNKMERGDVVYVRKRNPLYRLYRHYFGKDKVKIKVLKDWATPTQYVTYYQEDCILIYNYEIQCNITYKDEIPVTINPKKCKHPVFRYNLPIVQISLYNIQLIFKNNWVVTIPLDPVEKAIMKNKTKLNELAKQRLSAQQLQYQQYKGNTFKQKVLDKDIKEWDTCYCSVCGKPLTFIFNENDITVDNKCSCGNTKCNYKKLTYDELSIWYAMQVNPSTKSLYKKFWFEE